MIAPAYCLDKAQGGEPPPLVEETDVEFLKRLRQLEFAGQNNTEKKTAQRENFGNQQRHSFKYAVHY